MPSIRINDVRLHYRTDGDPTKQCVVLSNSLGTDLSMWDAQAAALASDFYVLRYDTRGHGQSESGGAAVSLATLGHDVIGLLDALAIPRAHFCGISMGGMVGQWLGIHQPQRIDKLVLANTAARIGSAEGWSARAEQVRTSGLAGVADGAAARWFTPDFIARAPEVVDGMIRRLRDQDAQGYAACCEALAQADLRDAIPAIGCAPLIVAGRADPVTTVEDARWLANRIAGAQVAEVDASHISNIEAEQAFSSHLLRFLHA
jgi:3-oxoadipate enol-lactonase